MLGGMARLSSFKVTVPIAGGFALNWMARGFGARGDLARLNGDDAGALSGHLGGLLLVIAALTCFAYAGWQIFKGLRGGGRSGGDRMPPTPVERVIDPGDLGPTEEPFDADAIMARYLAKREATGMAPPSAAEAPAARPSFGRKRV